MILITKYFFKLWHNWAFSDNGVLHTDLLVNKAEPIALLVETY